MLSLENLKVYNSRQISVLKKRSIRSIKDLLFYFPRKYIDRSKPLNLQNTKAGEEVTFIGTIVNVNTSFRGKHRLSAIVDYDGYLVQLTFFQGIKYYGKVLQNGLQAAFSGKVDFFRNQLTIVHPEIEFLTGAELLHTGKIVPLYKTTEMMRNAYITSRTLREGVVEGIKAIKNSLVDHLNNSFLEQARLLPLTEAISFMHFPSVMEDVQKARERIAFDELLVFAAFMEAKKEKVKQLQKLEIPETKNELRKIILDILPFELTNDQKSAIAEIDILRKKSYPFGALLQGDVGSGKTLVALFSALPYIEAGVQVALMAPTEILARQHYRNFLDYVSSIPMFPIDILLGAEKKVERSQKIDRIKRGETRLLIGTHSLLQDDVVFENLAFVIIDEQHRFGVEQREKLRSKGVYVDLLSMTATPIPRSLSLTFYGDLEQIVIREKPANRKPIDTRLFEESQLRKLYKGIKKYVNQGRQAYIVYPLIEESEKTQWASLMADYHDLEENHFHEYRLGLLHGKLKPEEKDNAMEKFKMGMIQVLVSTTVIEVGVDVPNASVMLIRNAEKFGLSQLHQLRGRVGRGKHQSFCILVHSNHLTPQGEKRLQAMVDSDDGFFLAEKDFEIRGAGELLGLNQAGSSEFRIADLREHARLAQMAREYIQKDMSLREKLLEPKVLKNALNKGLVLFAN